MTPVHPQHLAKLKKCFSKAPTQLEAGDSPRNYCQRLEEITETKLILPKEITDDALSRAELQKLCGKSSTAALVCYAAIMAWGRRGVKPRNYRISLKSPSLDALTTLRASKHDRQTDFAAFQKAASNIKGLGISFFACTIPGGASSPESQWPRTAEDAVAGMNELFVTITEII